CLPLRFGKVRGGIGLLLRRKRLEQRVANVELRPKSRAWSIGLFVNVEDLPRGVLDQAVVTAINNAWRKPREKLCPSGLVNRFSFRQSRPRNLDIEILRSCEPQDSFEIDCIGLSVRRKSQRKDARGAKAPRRKKSPISLRFCVFALKKVH